MVYDNLTASQLQLLDDIRAATSSGNYEREFQANFPPRIQGVIVLIPLLSGDDPMSIECEESDFQELVTQKFISITMTSRDSYKGRFI